MDYEDEKQVGFVAAVLDVVCWLTTERASYKRLTSASTSEVCVFSAAPRWGRTHGRHLELSYACSTCSNSRDLGGPPFQSTLHVYHFVLSLALRHWPVSPQQLGPHWSVLDGVKTCSGELTVSK